MDQLVQSKFPRYFFQESRRNIAFLFEFDTEQRGWEHAKQRAPRLAAFLALVCPDLTEMCSHTSRPVWPDPHEVWTAGLT